MDLYEKLGVLADAAKYDVSCSSSGGSRKNEKGVGNSHAAGICHTWSDDGRCVSLLKILLSNECIYDCVYCVNRASNDVPRASFTAEEVVQLTMNFYRRNYIEGLFLSSAVLKNPTHTMELMLAIVKRLRVVEKFYGYIHIKAIPGADQKVIDEAGLYVDRMSINVELPSDRGLEVLAPQKPAKALLKPMKHIGQKIVESKEERKTFKKSRAYVPAGQSTQLIVGATPDRDLSILKLSEALYNSFSLKRVYYSAFVPTVTDPRLPALIKPPLLREHRLYQADWLLRFYGFEADELLDKTHPNFDPMLDPKAFWAMRNRNLFPIEVNTADYEMLLRVPGIGIQSARRIIEAKRVGRLNFDHLKKMGIVLKRAGHFLTCMGKTYDSYSENDNVVKNALISAKLIPKSKKFVEGQLSLFPMAQEETSNYLILPDNQSTELLLPSQQLFSANDGANILNDSSQNQVLFGQPSNNTEWLTYYNQPQDGRLLISDIHL